MPVKACFGALTLLSLRLQEYISDWFCSEPVRSVPLPTVTRTIIPRIKKSLQERGFATTLRRSVLLPLHLLREYRVAKSLRPELRVSEFDRAHGVDTDGRFGGCTYLSDLDIHRVNWIDGVDYLPIEPDRFKRVLECFDISFEGLTFIDFGSGKGRA
jgi:hypothetical protein